MGTPSRMPNVQTLPSLNRKLRATTAVIRMVAAWSAIRWSPGGYGDADAAGAAGIMIVFRRLDRLACGRGSSVRPVPRREEGEVEDFTEADHVRMG